MKVLFLISSLSFGGAEKQTVLDANIISQNHDVTLLTFKEGPLKELVNSNITVIIIEKRGYVKTANKLFKYFRRKKIDLIHSSLFAAIVLATLASIFSNIKIIWHFHSHEYDIPLKARLTFQWLAKLPNVKKILFVNHELLDHFSSYKFPETKTEVLYNHSEISEIQQIKEHDSKSLIHIGYVGRVVQLKRVHYLVELIEYFINRNVTRFKIHIVGDGDDLNRIIDFVFEKQLNDFIEFHGFQKDVIPYYKKFDIFINPSSEECLSMSMIDAGMMALPVVAFDVGGNNEIVLHEKTGFIANSKDEFFIKCLTLARDRNMRMNLGSMAYQHCNSLFSKEKHRNTLGHLYDELFY